jgi:hypothetical protein
MGLCPLRFSRMEIARGFGGATGLCPRFYTVKMEASAPCQPGPGLALAPVQRGSVQRVVREHRRHDHISIGQSIAAERREKIGDSRNRQCQEDCEKPSGHAYKVYNLNENYL